MSFPATASYPSVASYASAATYPSSAAYPSIWTPAQLGAAMFLWETAGRVILSGPSGISVASAQFGTTVAAAALLNGNTQYPTLTGSGMQMDQNGDDSLTITPQVVAGAFTYVFVGIATSNANWIPIGSSLQVSSVGFLFSALQSMVIDDNGAVVSMPYSTYPSQPVLFLVTGDGLGNVTVKYTGFTNGGTTGGFGTFTLDSIGNSSGISSVDGDAANRHNLQSINTSDLTGTPTLTKYLAWLEDNLGASLIDPDAANIIAYYATNGQTLDGTHIDAINNLVGALKGQQLWAQINSLFLVLGLDAATDAIDAKNLTNTAAFHGGVTHGTHGITGDGSTGYMDTGITAALLGAAGGLSAYVTQYTSQSNSMATGLHDAVAGNLWLLLDNASRFYTEFGGTTVAAVVNTAPVPGFFSSNRTSSTALRLDFNGALVDSNSTPVMVASSSLTLYALANNDNSSAEFFMQGSIGLLAYHSGFSTGDSANLYSAVQTFQTALGRNV